MMFAVEKKWTKKGRTKYSMKITYFALGEISINRVRSTDKGDSIEKILERKLSWKMSRDKIL